MPKRHSDQIDVDVHVEPAPTAHAAVVASEYREYREYSEYSEYNDQLTPHDWPASKRWLHIAIVASMTMATPLASSIHTPALPQIAADFSVDRSVASLSVPLYVLGFATGPLVFLPLSKVYGRLHIYNAANFLLLFGNLGCALAPAFAWLLVFRFLAGCAGACAITQGSGTIADIIEKENRGKAVALMAFGTVWAPVLGPVIGGHIAEKFGWRGCFWVLICVGTFNSMLTLLFMEETSTTHTTHESGWVESPGPYLLQSTHNYAKIEDNSASHAKRLKQVVLEAVFAPFYLLSHPLFLILCLLSATFYSIQIFLYVDIPATYKLEYDFTPSQTGLAFLGNGVGMTVGLLVFGLTSDRIMIKLAGAGPRKPEYRLPLMLSVTLVSGGLAVYGLAASPSTNWIYPIMANGFTGAGLYSFSMTASTYLIDLSPEKAADSATLLATVRFPFGAVVCALSEKIVILIGRTATKEIFATIALFALPVIYFLYRHGENVRTRRIDVF